MPACRILLHWGSYKVLIMGVQNPVYIKLLYLTFFVYKLTTTYSVQIRCEGIRLFLLWLQALRDSCAEEQFLIFACLIPGFPAVPSSRGLCTLDTIIYNPFSNPSDGESKQMHRNLLFIFVWKRVDFLKSDFILFSSVFCPSFEFEQPRWSLRRLHHWFRQ